MYSQASITGVDIQITIGKKYALSKHLHTDTWMYIPYQLKINKRKEYVMNKLSQTSTNIHKHTTS